MMSFVIVKIRACDLESCGLESCGLKNTYQKAAMCDKLVPSRK
jgi:hypothetical protein